MSRDRNQEEGVNDMFSELDELPGPAPALSQVQLNAQASDIVTRFCRERDAVSPSAPEEHAVLQPLDGAPGPAPSRSDLQAHAMAHAVSAQMAARDSGIEPTDALPGPAPVLDEQQTDAVARRLVSRRRQRMLWQSAAATLLVASLGGAAFAAVQMWVAPPDEQPSSSSKQADSSSGSSAAAEVSPSTPPPQKSEPSAQPRRAERAEASPDPRAPEQPAPPRAKPSTDEASRATRLLQRANEARAQRRWQRAEQLYVRVAREHRRRNQAYAATVAAASLKLEHTEDPEGALKLYRRALQMQPDGALSEQARYGVAVALRALGRQDAEREALQEFLERYPKSLMQHSIRARLDSLAGAR